MNAKQRWMRGRVEHCPNRIGRDRDARVFLLRASLGNIQVSRFRSLEGRR